MRRLFCIDGLSEDHNPVLEQLGTFAASFVDTSLEDVAAGDVAWAETPAGQGDSDGGVAAASLPGMPVLNSKPDAAATIFLDFDGHFEPTWGSSYSNITTPVFDTDGNPSSFAGAEILRINQVFNWVAEDYAPFDINVTTVEPPSFGNGEAIRVSIGGNGSWSGGTYGGIAYINSFTSSIVNTVYVFPANLGNSSRNIADASSHESGHSFGEQHQSEYSGSTLVNEYYAGPGDGRAPIMGNSYAATRSIWWRGPSLSSTTIQDDMFIISRGLNGFGYRADDYGDTAAAAFALPAGSTFAASGIITKTTDVDYFSFEAAAGPATFSMTVPSLVANLDSKLELRDALGNLITSAAPTNSLSATISTALAGGSYRLVAASNGVYGDVGKYTLAGTVVAPGSIVAAPTSLEAVAVGAQEIDLSWQDNATNETGYRIERSTNGDTWSQLGSDLPAGTTSFADTTVVDETTYYYRVKALGASADSEYSNVDSATTPLLVGDMNDDDTFDNFDIGPFELALTEPDDYAALYPSIDDRIARGDVNGDGFFDNFDIQPFEDLLVSGGLIAPPPGESPPSAAFAAWAAEADGPSAIAQGLAASLDVYQPAGNFVLRPDKGGAIPLPASLLSNPNIAGFVLRDEWKNVNPAPGIYDFSRLDAAIATVTAAGKQFKLTIFTGIAAPQWLYHAGAQSVAFHDDNPFREGGDYVMPAPWDPTMLRYYGDLLLEMHRHFAGNPGLVQVNLGGPTQFSLEMHLPSEVKQAPGYSAQAIRTAWASVLKTYATLFPGVRAGLQIGNPFQASDGIAAAVTADAVSILGNRLALQHNALSAKPDLESYNIHQLVQQYAAAGVHTGYEALCASNIVRFGGSMDTAWQRIISDGGKYFDFYVPDDQLLHAFPNFAPQFFKGEDQVVYGDGLPRDIAAWATGIAAGPLGEAGQAISFTVVGNSNPGLFTAPPTVDPATGNLSFVPALNATGNAKISLKLADTGGTADGGKDSTTLTFNVTVLARILHNSGDPLDVNNDGVVTVLDPLIVINAINASTITADLDPHDASLAAAQTAGTTSGGPLPTHYVDVSGDSKLSPLDALIIINYLNEKSTFKVPTPQAASVVASPAVEPNPAPAAIHDSRVSLGLAMNRSAGSTTAAVSANAAPSAVEPLASRGGTPRAVAGATATALIPRASAAAGRLAVRADALDRLADDFDELVELVALARS